MLAIKLSDHPFLLNPEPTSTQKPCSQDVALPTAQGEAQFPRQQREEQQMLDSSTPWVLLDALVSSLPMDWSPWTLGTCPRALCAAPHPVQPCEAQKVTPPSLSLLRAQQAGEDSIQQLLDTRGKWDIIFPPLSCFSVCCCFPFAECFQSPDNQKKNIQLEIFHVGWGLFFSPAFFFNYFKMCCGGQEHQFFPI